MEIWKDIEGYEGKYQISNEGRVKALAWNGFGKGKNQKEHILHQADLRGYKRVGLSKDGVVKWFSVHRLVAMAFISNPNNYLVVDHINTIRDDNRVENLRWVTQAENNRNDITVSKHIGLLVNRKDQSKKVYQYDLDGNLVSEYPSVDLAVSDKKAIFQFGYTLVATRLIAGDYPNTRNIVPKISNYTLEVNAQDLIKAIDRAKILTIERENVVDLSMDSESVEISAKSSQVGSAVENIEIFRFEGDSLKVSFNSEFVCQAIKSLNSQDVIFSFVGEMKPFVIKNASDDSVVQVVTPCKTY